MGINGLLPIFKCVQEEVHLREYGGKTVAVDGNVWLYRGLLSCIYDHVTDTYCDRYLFYFKRYLTLLLKHNVKPLIVFDGKSLPIKQHTHTLRIKRRQEAHEKANALMKEGKVVEASNYFRRAMCPKPEMIVRVIKTLQKMNIPYVLSPYEADSQLAYLAKTKMVDAVISEDSDLLVFGCSTVLYKMDASGTSFQLRQKDLTRTDELDISGWSLEKIRRMCILSGCDYLPSLPGIGIKRAHGYIKRNTTMDAVFRELRQNGKMKDRDDYEDLFKKAEQAFLYQHIFDPVTRTYTSLSDVPDTIDIHSLDFLGKRPASVEELEIELFSATIESIRLPPMIFSGSLNKRQNMNTSIKEELVDDILLKEGLVESILLNEELIELDVKSIFSEVFIKQVVKEEVIKEEPLSVVPIKEKTQEVTFIKEESLDVVPIKEEEPQEAVPIKEENSQEAAPIKEEEIPTVISIEKEEPLGVVPVKKEPLGVVPVKKEPLGVMSIADMFREVLIESTPHKTVPTKEKKSRKLVGKKATSETMFIEYELPKKIPAKKTAYKAALTMENPLNAAPVGEKGILGAMHFNNNAMKSKAFYSLPCMQDVHINVEPRDASCLTHTPSNKVTDIKDTITKVFPIEMTAFNSIIEGKENIFVSTSLFPCRVLIGE
ncbi:PIN domain-like protein [Spinellus fusiger]|nr:PIN domain-like protein [Spinellus fusiger]